MLKTAFGLVPHLLGALETGMLPTLVAVLSQPWILFQPTKLGRLFFAQVWEKGMGDGVDEGARVFKEGELSRSQIAYDGRKAAGGGKTEAGGRERWRGERREER